MIVWAGRLSVQRLPGTLKWITLCADVSATGRAGPLPGDQPFGISGGPPQVIFGPPRDERTASLDLGPQINGQPSASLQKYPTSCEPSHASAPMNFASARNLLPGSMTQNSLPSGSASTSPPSAAGPRWRYSSDRSASGSGQPSASGSRRNGSEIQSHRSVGARCRRVGSSAISQPRTPAQKRARRSGSLASKQSARS